jgi:Bacterial Ig-like domain (group 2)
MVAPTPARRLVLFAGLLTAVLMSCGRELTGPRTAPVNAFKRFASVAFSPQYETAVRGPALQAALTQVAFERVRITLRREDGSIALDTVVTFSAGLDSLVLSLTVSLPADAPASGVPLSLNLGYVNAAGDTVFKGGPISVMALPSTGGGTPPPPVLVPVHYTGTGANATAVVISPKTVNGTAGQTASFSAQALASNGQVITGTPVVFTSSDEGVVRLDPITGIGNLTGRGTARVYAQLLTGPRDSATVSVVLPASRIELVSGGAQTAPAGTALAQPVVARVLASDGVGAAGVTVSFAVTTGGGSVTPASAVSAADGSVSASWKLGSLVGAQALSVSATGLAGSPLAVSATALATTPSKLSLVAQPANGVAGSPLAPVTVAAQTADGVTVATFAGDVTVAFGVNPGGATLGGTTTVTAVNGIATFTGLSLNRPGSGYTLVFSSTTLSSATSSPFGIVAGSAARLVFGAMSSAVDVGIAIAPPIQVTAQDSAGNTVTSFTGAVTMAIGNNPGASTLSGTLTRTAVAGVATFNDLSLNKKGASYTLVASASGMAGGTSAAFNAAAGAPTGISVVSGGGQTAAAGTTLSPIVLKLRDALDNGISGVTISLAVATGGGSLGAASAVTDADGLVTVSWMLGGTGGIQSITAAATGVSTATITATATGGTSNKLAVTTPPNSTQTAGVALAPSIVVQAQNSTNVLQTAFTGAVTATVASGPSGATIGGTATVTAVGGVATFSALRLTKAGAYTLQFASSGLASATTASFTVNSAPAQTIAADSGSAQSGTAGAPLAQKLVVLVTDSLGNPVSGRSVSWAVATGGGSVDSATTVTNSTGRTRVTFTLGLTAGSNAATATSSGLAGSPVTFTATGTGTVASTTVTPKVDTIISINATFALTAQSHDAATNLIAGHYTWISRAPSIAAVDTSGTVKAVANGSAWIVATETGGTKDSAQIVVQQRVATINVTPGSRNIYKTRNFAFAASAVDGMGNVMSGITSFTWSTVTPSVASVDTAGKVTAISLGSTQVRATAGAITGVATVTVLTPITRIIVGRDSSGVAVTDTTSLTALGTGRYYRAQARDTLDAPMTGVTFTWGSTNGAVAVVDTSLATSAHATANANGVTSVQAAADGVTGTAALKVQQVLASIELGPTPDTIGITGTVQLTARGKDSNSRYISGGSFTYASGTPAVATANATTGAVTGIALGSTNITATSGAITSNNAVVVVSTTVPPIISFGRDTLTVGRGSSVSIPLYLSRPNATAVTVNLAARDTNAYFSPASVTISAGSTTANANLYGRNAGTTAVYATDGSSTGYKGDTAVVAVQANMHLASSYWYLNSGDQVSSQVILSDPSPVGGTYVTFTYGTVGVARVSPDPAFIPAGQLSANIVITGSSATGANTSITPVATGVNGTASTMYVYAPVLSLSYATWVLGSGQYDQLSVRTPTNTVNALPLAFTSSDTSVATVTALTGTVAAGSYYSYYTVSGKRPGSASIIVSSPGWQPDTMPVTVTTPKVWISASYTSLTTTSPTYTLSVYTADSINTYYYYYSTHPRTSSLALTVSSSDTTVVKILDKSPVVAAGSSSASGIRYQPGGSGGTAWIKVTAGGHFSDSVQVTVVGPKLEFNWSGTNLLGKGQYEPYASIQTPNAVTSPLTITLTSSNAAKVSVPSTVTITSGSYYAYLPVSGLDTGFVDIIASAPGYQGDTASYRVTTPKVSIGGGGTLNGFGAGSGFSVYVNDSTSTYYYYSSHNRITPLVVSLRSTDTSVIKIDSSTVTITANTASNGNRVALPQGTGTAWIVASAPGHTPDSVQYTVQKPKLSFSFYSYVLGRRQYSSNSYYISTPNSRTVAVPVTITQSNAAADSLSGTTLTIPANSSYLYFGMAGRATGVDTIIATASGYAPDTAVIYISSPGLYQGGIPTNATTTSPPNTVYIATTDSLNYYYYTHPVLDTLVLTVVSSDTTVLRPTSKYVRIPKGSYSVYAGYSFVGPGSAYLTISDSAGTGYPTIITNTTTVTGPSLNFCSSTGMLGVRQSTGAGNYCISAPNNVTSPLTITLSSTDPSVAVPSPSTITMTAGSRYAYFTIIANDSIGTIQIQASAAGYNPPAPMTMQVTQPKLVVSPYYTTMRTTQPAAYITVYLADANGTMHYNTEAVTVSLVSSNTGVASIDSSTVTIPVNSQVSYAASWRGLSAGTSTLTISDPRASTYHTYNYASASSAVTVVDPALSFYLGPNTIGLGQYFDPASDYYYVRVGYSMTSPTTVALSHTGVAKTSVPATTTIAANTLYSYFKLTGTVIGTDTLTASLTSPLHTPATAYVVVDSGRVDSPLNWPSASMRVGDSLLVTLRTKDPNASYVRKVAAATAFTLAPSANVEVHVGGAVVTSVTVPADANQVQFYLKAKATGTGSVVFTHPNYKTYTPPTVTVIP